MSAPNPPPPDAPPELVIPAGKARLLIAGAIVDVLAALARLESLAIAVARQLDADAPTRVEPPPMPWTALGGDGERHEVDPTDPRRFRPRGDK